MEFNATFFVSIISFILFTIIMNCIFYAPLSKIINEREEMINSNYEEADKAKKTSDEIKSNREIKINEALKKSKQMVSDSTISAKSDAQKLKIDAKLQSQQKITEAKSNIQNDSDIALNDLKSNVKDLAQVISSKVLGIETDVAVNDEIINRIMCR